MRGNSHAARLRQTSVVVLVWGELACVQPLLMSPLEVNLPAGRSAHPGICTVALSAQIRINSRTSSPFMGWSWCLCFTGYIISCHDLIFVAVFSQQMFTLLCYFFLFLWIMSLVSRVTCSFFGICLTFLLPFY